MTCARIYRSPTDRSRALLPLQDLIVRQQNTKLFRHESIPKYEISLWEDSPMTTPIDSPKLQLHPLPTQPIEPRCKPDWRENEGYPESTVLSQLAEKATET